MHVIARNRDAVEFGHMCAGVRNNIRHNPHRWFWRIDIGVADHELLEDIILDCAVELGLANALLFASNNEERKDRDHCAVHRH